LHRHFQNVFAFVPLVAIIPVYSIVRFGQLVWPVEMEERERTVLNPAWLLSKGLISADA
jgi:hypothetical protein